MMEEKYLIYYDDREPDGIIKKVQGLGYETKREHLECSDYMLDHFIIERKTYNDIWGSINDRRIWDQLFKMKRYCEANGVKGIIIVIGSPYDIIRRIGSYNSNRVFNCLTGFMLASYDSFNIPVYHVADDEGFLLILDLMMKRDHKGTSYKPVGKKAETVEETKSDMLSSIEGIGRKTADDLASRYTIIELANMSKDEIESILIGTRKLGKNGLNIKKTLTT